MILQGVILIIIIIIIIIIIVIIIIIITKRRRENEEKNLKQAKKVKMRITVTTKRTKRVFTTSSVLL